MHDLFSLPPPPIGGEATFVALNVQSPPTARARDLAIWLHATDADGLILTELSGGAGSKQLIDDLSRLGYSSLYTPPTARDYAAAILLKRDAVVPIASPEDLGARIACSKLSGKLEGVLVAAYVPSLGPQNHHRRPLFLSKLSKFIAELQQGNTVLVMGDLNVIERGHLPRITAFEAEPLFGYDSFSDLGLVDGYRQLNPDGVDHSWFDRFGVGQRLDHALMSPSLLERTSDCCYLHDVRTKGLSDHSALALRLRRSSDYNSV